MHSRLKMTHSLPFREKFTARQTGTTQPDFARRRSTHHQRSDRNFDARPTGSTHSRPGTMQPNFQRGIDTAPALIHALRQEKGPRVPVIAAEKCLLKQGSDSVTPREILSILLVQAEDRQSSEDARPGNLQLLAGAGVTELQ
ncbi:hypothetical protein NDU88_004004 [Pleurodeles waltl]|uniref:Uncharacterized protein n=1 Tax=Pleurodeles waltl TaxID=8319 RepID=A0AAV7N084_PLEWA|nr:hypothetical protein NDU88_004004 [Pleurodeles waltl]